MCGEAKNECNETGSKSESGCCPEMFQEMFGKMSGCCADKDNLPDCAEIMSRMKAGCCGLESEREKK